VKTFDNNIPRSALYILFLPLILVLCGCSGITGLSAPISGGARSGPSITAFQVSPNQIRMNSGDGIALVRGTVSFADPAHGVSTVTLTTFDVLGNPVCSTSPVAGGAGVRSGTLTIAVQVFTGTAGVFPFHVYVTNEAGARSNAVTAMFKVVKSNEIRI
jgi:hypothetical protein